MVYANVMINLEPSSFM